MRQDYVIHWLPDDPEHILLGIDADLDGRTEVRRVDVNNGRFTVIDSGHRGIRRWITDPAGQLRYGFGEDGGKRWGIYRAPGSKKFMSVTDTPWFKREMQPIVFDVDEPHMAYAEGKVEAGDDTNAVVKLNMQSGEVVELIHQNPTYDSWVLYAQTDHRFLGYGTPNGPVILDSQRARLQASIDHVFKDSRNAIVTHSPDWRRLIVRVRSDVEAGALYYWNRDTREMSFIGAAYPGLSPELMSPMQRVRYAARDGLEIEAFLTIPRGLPAENLPLIIMPHGGPFSADGWGFDFMTQMMASRGFAVLQPNFRGSVLQGEAFHEAGKKQWGGKMQDDLSDGVRYLVDEGIADPERVCIVGWSYGGYAALMGAITTPDLYRCAVSINGETNLRRIAARFSFDLDYRRFVREYIGLENANLSDVSPSKQVADVGVPVLLVHAADDHRVPIKHADEMASKLERHGKPFEYERIEFGGGHSLLNGDARLRMMQSLEAFLLRHLGAQRELIAGQDSVRAETVP